MQDDRTGLLEAPCEFQRVVARVGPSGGAVLIALGGIHGNEPSGLQAIRAVADQIRALGLPLRGELICLAGNLGALAAGARFVDLDMNRQWTKEQVAAALRGGDGPEPAEHREMRELLGELIRTAAEARGPLHFLDLHTSSADGPPFLTVGDTMRNRAFARQLPLPLILGLEEQVDGALLEYLNNRGLITMGVEAGQHEDPGARDCHEAVLWLSLIAAGIIEEEHVPALGQKRRLLHDLARGVPRVIEVRHRHAIQPGDGFHMDPDYLNFQWIERGHRVAEDNLGPIQFPESGRILLPLYQGQGDDGFFACRDVRLFWIRVSAILRRLPTPRLLGWLPGVKWCGGPGEMLRVNTRVARIFPLEIFHLLGFRKQRWDGSELMVSRRRYDFEGPARYELTSQVWPE